MSRTTAAELIFFVVAVESSRQLRAGLALSRRSWGRAQRTWKCTYEQYPIPVKMENDKKLIPGYICLYITFVQNTSQTVQKLPFIIILSVSLKCLSSFSSTSSLSCQPCPAFLSCLFFSPVTPVSLLSLLHASLSSSFCPIFPRYLVSIVKLKSGQNCEIGSEL